MKKTALILAIFMMTGAVAAAPSETRAGITPASPFYFAEQLAESLELAVAKSQIIGSLELEAKVRANQADERLAEAQKLLEKNKTKKAEKMMERYSRQMSLSFQSAEKANNPELSDRLNDVSSKHVEVLKQVEKKVPEQARKGIQKAIENSQRNQRQPNIPDGKPRGRKNPDKGKAGKPQEPAQNPESPTVDKPKPPVGPTQSNTSDGQQNSSGSQRESIGTGETTERVEESRKNGSENSSGSGSGSKITGEATGKPPVQPENQGLDR